MAKQGWLELGSSVEAGGFRYLAVLLEELGRAGCPAPLADAFIANRLLSADPQASSLLARLHAGDASISLAAGMHDGDANAGSPVISAKGDSSVVDGRAAFVEGAATATHFLVLGAGSSAASVEADTKGVSVSPSPGLSVPPLSDVLFEDASATSHAVASPVLSAIAPIRRLALATRALGAASRGFDLIVDYARVRVQFGRKIGQFQAIQHKLANCLVQLETSRLALWRAAAAYDRGDDDWSYVCGTAVSLASPALRQVCLETHHAFGGVSFWEEHEMPRHFRRIHADLVRCGGVYAARQDVARSLFDGARS
jgi:alkylation response protein AidB-like acyl-CoA dehydrogenase